MKRQQFLAWVLSQIEADVVAENWEAVKEWAARYRVSPAVVKRLIRKYAATEEGAAMTWRMVFAPADNASGRTIRYEHGLARRVEDLAQATLKEERSKFAWDRRSRNRWAAVAEMEARPVERRQAEAMVAVFDAKMADQSALIEMLEEASVGV